MRIETNTTDSAPADIVGQPAELQTVTELCARRDELEKVVDALWDRHEAAVEAAKRDAGEFPAVLKSKPAAECGNHAPIRQDEFERDRHWLCACAARAHVGGQSPTAQQLGEAEREIEQAAFAYYERRAEAWERHNVDALKSEAEAATSQFGDAINAIFCADPRDLSEATMQLDLIADYFHPDEGVEFAVRTARRILALQAN